MKVKIVNESAFELPKYQTRGSSGMDVRANIETTITLYPMERKLIPTGLYMEMEESIECQVRPRSGLALKKGITVLNSPGTIDADYRGEIGVILVNVSKEPVEIEKGERIAQLVFCEVKKIEFSRVNILESSHRGDGGFGSTGNK